MSFFVKRLLLVCLSVISAAAEADVIPLPADDRALPGEFVFSGAAIVSAPVSEIGLYLRILTSAGINAAAAAADSPADIQFLSENLLPDRYPVPEDESYVLRITPEVINIHAATRAGHFYGLQTLAQIIERAVDKAGAGPVRIPCRNIIDSPRFAWRGFMLDESRHFTGEAGVKRLIDAMARFKLNRLHWRLTDSAGWRIEIRKFPELTRIGARGSETDRRPDVPAEFYSQDQIREIVAYAKQRAITIIPEIDMPGHADAAVSAYPQHDGGGYESKTDPRKWPRFTFNPAKKETLEFLDDILSPRLPCYFDFVQHDSHVAGLRWNGYNPLDQTYLFPAELELSAADESKVLGIQGCLWTEATITQASRDFMTWPRLIALAEAAWTVAEKKDFACFKSRLKPQLRWLDAQGIAYYDPYGNSCEITDDDVGATDPDFSE